jgi:transcriptional regulator with XRE-family HTH domain
VSGRTDTVTPPALAPVLGRRWLAAELGRLRRAADITQAEAAGAVGWSTSKQIRIENGQVGLSQVGVTALAALYGVADPDRVAELCTAASGSGRQPWSQYRDVLTPGVRGYLGMEHAASAISMFRHSVVPGPLRTVAYAHAVTAAIAAPGWGPSRVRQRTQADLDRRAILERPDPPRLTVLLDEAVVAHLTAGDAGMREQLVHLRQLADRPQLTIRYVPHAFGVHRGHHLEFTLASFPRRPTSGAVPTREPRPRRTPPRPRRVHASVHRARIGCPRAEHVRTDGPRHDGRPTSGARRRRGAPMTPARRRASLPFGEAPFEATTGAGTVPGPVFAGPGNPTSSLGRRGWRAPRVDGPRPTALAR